jgi:hypothetical protein
MANNPAPTGLDEFRSVIADYRGVSSWMIGGTVAVPLVDFVLRLGPPWPAGVAVITSVAELLTLIFAFHFWYRQAFKQVTRRMRISLAILLICFGVYLYLNSAYTFTSPVDGEKFVKGLSIRPDVKPLIRNGYTPDDALKGAEYQAREVWTSSSIDGMRIALLILWLGSFVSLAVFIASFVMYQRRRRGHSSVQPALHK